MLQMLREKAQGIVTWFVVLAIIAAFAFFGLSDYFSFGHSHELAAKVSGQKISWAAVDKLYDKVSQQYGNQINSQALKDQILMAMIQRAAWLKAARSLGLQVGEEQVAALLVQIPTFQVEGKFSKEQYLKVLADAAYTDVGFRQELSQDVLLGQIERGFMQSGFIMPNEFVSTVALLDQKRDFGYALITVQQYQKTAKIPAEKVQSYYEAHKGSFVQPEQVALEYVELSIPEVAKSVHLAKQEVLDYYEEHKAQYAMPERVHARHILIRAPQADAALSKQAKDKIDQILVRLKKTEDFTTLAKSVSEDPGSAKNGGDLGWFVRGQMVPEFEEVAFGLKAGAISEPVRTQFGYHIIQLVEHRNSEQRPFLEVKNLVEEQLKKERVDALFAEQVALFDKLAFEETSGFASIVDQLRLTVKETELFSRVGRKEGIASNPEVLQVAFSEDLLQQGRNSVPIKLSETATAVFRVKKHIPAEQQTLQQVENKIQERLAFEQAKTQVKEIGEELVSKIKEGANPMQTAKQKALEWAVRSDVLRMAGDIDRQVTMAAFQMPVLDHVGQNVKGFALPNGDYLVLVLDKVKLGNVEKLNAETQNAYRQSLIEVSSQLEYALYTNQALREAKIEILKKPSS
jgi:peptidyl-prolyl cis-trans isomerase D